MASWQYGQLVDADARSLTSSIFGQRLPTFTAGGYKREFNSLDEALSTLGLEGWEMVSQSSESDSNWTYTTYTFKRYA